MVNAEYLANLLVSASQQVIIAHIKDWLANKHPNAKLEYRVGTGKATYLQSKGNDEYLISYGKKMVSSQTSSYIECARWTNGREILTRNYYYGWLTPQTALAHVAIHETGHFVQSLMGRVYKGSHHNAEYYEILDRMHASGVGLQVLEYLDQDKYFRTLEWHKWGGKR